MVIDQTDLKAVEAVYIFGHSASVMTNTKGQGDLQKFEKNDTLTFSHLSYQTERYTFQELKEMAYKVKLKEKSFSMNEIIFATRKWEQKTDEVPNQIHAIKARDIAFSNPQTSADLVTEYDQVFLQKSQLGGGSPMIRGFAANSILLVIDGVRMNNAIYRSGNLQNIISIDPNIIENTEIILGPGSVIYGSDALGGVIDFHTKKALLNTGKKTETTMNAMTRYSTINKEKTIHFDLNYGSNKWALLSSVSYSNFDDLRMGSVGNDEYRRDEYASYKANQDMVLNNPDPDVQLHSGYSQLNVLEKLRYRPNDNIDMNYSFHYSRISDVPRYDRLIQYSGENLKYGDWYYGPQEWIMNSFQLKHQKKSRFYDQFLIVAAWQKYEESRHDRKFGNEKIRERYEFVDAVSLNVDFDKEFKKDNSLYYGMEAVYNHVKSVGEERKILTGFIEPAPSRYPDQGTDYLTLAAYVSYKYNITDKIVSITGMRFSHIRLNSEFSNRFYDFPYSSISMNPSAISGSIGLVYNPDSTLRLNVNISTGFRAPNLDDVGKVFDSEPGVVIVPNENLTPVYVYNFETGIEKQIKESVKFEVRAFYTYLDNAMVRRGFLFDGKDSIYYDGELSKVEAIVNADNAHIYGGAIAFKSEILNWLSFKTSLNYSNGLDKDGLPLRHIAPFFGSSHFIFSLKKFRADINSRYNGSIRYINLSPSERNKAHIYAADKNGNPYSPSWWTINMKFSYQLNPHIQVNAGIDNLLDHRYRPYSSGIVSAGRNLYIALRGRF